MRFLVCGVGSIGLRHLKNLRALGYSDIILYRTGKSTINDDSGALNGLQVFSSLEVALEKSPDVCIISNPSSLHLNTAIKCARAGCHLFIEKPLSDSLDGLDELNEIVKESNLITFITYQFRYHPHIRILKKILASEDDKFGYPIYASAEWSEYLPDWHPWEDYRKSYSARKELGGGVFLTQVHPINYLSYLFGPIKALTHKQYISGSLDIEVNDSADSLLEFNSGMIGHVHVDYIQKPRVHKLKVVMSEGRFEWDYHANSLDFISKDGTVDHFPNDKFDRNDMFVSMLSEFIDCVKHNIETDFNLKDATHELHHLLAR
jgi:predicted dehydrogenase